MPCPGTLYLISSLDVVTRVLARSVTVVQETLVDIDAARSLHTDTENAFIAQLKCTRNLSNIHLFCISPPAPAYERPRPVCARVFAAPVSLFALVHVQAGPVVVGVDLVAFVTAADGLAAVIVEEASLLAVRRGIRVAGNQGLRLRRGRFHTPEWYRNCTFAM